MALTASHKHKIIQNLYRNYTLFLGYLNEQGEDVFDYTVETSKGSGEYVTLSFCFSDLKLALQKVKLSPRTAQAFKLNVLEDRLQKEVAQIMGITTVSVGQYADAAAMRIANWYFGDASDREAIEAKSGETVL